MDWLWFERPHHIRGVQCNPYYWLWHDFSCRLEPWSPQLRRHVARWWGLDIAVAGIAAGIVLWLLLFPPGAISAGWRIAIIVIGALAFAFFTWLLLHLGGFAMKFRRLFHG